MDKEKVKDILATIFLLLLILICGSGIPAVILISSALDYKNVTSLDGVQDAADTFGWNVVGWYIDEYGREDYLDRLKQDSIEYTYSRYDRDSDKLYFGDKNESKQEEDINVSENNTTGESNQSDLEYMEKPFWVNTESTPLNIRKEPNQNSTIIGSIPRGENITVYTITDNWGFVNYGDIGGWVNLLYCEHGYAPADLQNASNPTVWIADSPTAYAYHSDPNCYFLNLTTHEILEVSVEYAKSHGHADPCDHCVLGKK